MRQVLRHKLVLCIALVCAVSGFNVFAAAPLLSEAAFCVTVDNTAADTCQHCTSGGTEKCTCGSGDKSTEQVLICSCGEAPGETAPLPLNLPTRADTGKDLHIASAAVSSLNLSSTRLSAHCSTVAIVAEDTPIYLWNCILRT